MIYDKSMMNQAAKVDNYATQQQWDNALKFNISDSVISVANWPQNRDHQCFTQ